MKKLFLCLMVLISIFAVALSGCSSDGKFYTLQEAYDNGFLTKEDLEQIAYYNNNEIEYPETLDKSVEQKIKEVAAEYLRNREVHPVPQARASGITILKYLGAYSGNYVLMLKNKYDLYPTDIPDIWEDIEEVSFHYIGYYIIAVIKIK